MQYSNMRDFIQHIMKGMDDDGHLQVDVTGSVDVNGAPVTQVTGAVAHDVADAGNPIKLGGKASAAIPTAVADGDRVNAYLDIYGNQYTKSGGLTVKINSTITRDATTTTYTAGDAVESQLSTPANAIITNAARYNGGSGVILNAMLIDSAAQTLAGEFEVWVFDTTMTPDGDNALFTPTDAECATLVAVIPFSNSYAYVGTSTAGAGGNRVYQSDPVNRGFVCGAASKNLFWTIVARNAYIPVANEAFTLRLTIMQD
jgi:hypothetical protein